MLHNALGGYRIKLHNVINHFGSAFSPYITGFYAKSLKPVGLLRSVAKDMYLPAALLVPCGKLDARNGLNAVAFTQNLSAADGRHCVVICDRNKIKTCFLSLNNNIFNSQRAVRKRCVAMKVTYHKLISQK